MSLARREFLQALTAAGIAGFGLGRQAEADAATVQKAFYDLPPFGNVSLLHLTDCHAQLLPLHYREPSVNLGVGAGRGRLPHRVGKAWLDACGIAPGTPLAHAYTGLDFEGAARRYGRLGGFAAIATLVKLLRASRPGALLLDGGDSWQGSATALWSGAQDMVDACKLLGVDVMTGHWEFTYGMARVQQVVEHDFAGRIDFIAQNVATADFGDPVFAPWVMRRINGVRCAIVGQAFPYTPIANPRHFVADWRFGIQEESLQRHVEAARADGAQLVVLLSHNGMDVDLKLASRVTGIDAIFGGHTHDGVPLAIPVANPGGVTLVTNAGSHGKFLGVMDFEVKGSRLVDWRYTLLPVFADAIEPDPAMQALIARVRRPHLARLAEPLATTDGLLWRRGNFNGAWDQLICDALRAEKGADIAFSPGFRWGGTLLPGDVITREALMDQTAITYPWTSVSEMTGEQIKAVLEDVADNLFNPDPYYQQGGDMVRTGGLAYTCAPHERIGRRIGDLRLKGEPLDADKAYRVAGWASVAEGARDAAGAEPVWDLVARWLRAQGGSVATRRVDVPALVGVDPADPGLSAA